MINFKQLRSKEEYMEIIETFLYHDGPMLFSAIKGEERYLCLMVDESEDSSKYLLSPLSSKVYGDLRNESKPLRDFFTPADLKIGEWSNGEWSIRELTHDEVEEIDTLLPAKGVFFRASSN